MQAELHRHLDVSVRMTTLLELAQARGLEGQSTSLGAFREKIELRKPLSDLKEVLATFGLFQHVLDRPEVLERVAFEVVEDCWNDGTRLVELRFSPSFVCEHSGMIWNDALNGFHAGMTRALKAYPGMKAGLLCIASRDYGTEEVARTADFFLHRRDRFVGMDLAGNEKDFPCRMFESALKKVRDSGAPLTIHAGEATGPENIWEAIDLLGAKRIGHGISAVQDPKLLEELRKRSICLEMCPTSNWLTRAVPDLAHHPLPQVLRAGVPVCINTDDPAVFAVSLTDEAEICRKDMGMSEAEIQACFDHAVASSFIGL